MNDLLDGAHYDSISVRTSLITSGIQEILNYKGLTEVAINEPLRAWFERGNGWETIELPNLTFDMCMDLAKALAVYAQIPRLLSDVPIASVTLPDGERGQIALPPVTKKGVVSMTFRKPSKSRFTLEDYSKTGRFSNFSNINSDDFKLSSNELELLDLKANRDVSGFFELAVKSNLNIILVGGTGSGKSTVMKAMVDNYPKDKRLFTIEDVHEIDLPHHPNHLNLFYKEGGVTPKKLIESCMRMKPDHVFLAELRGDEAWSYLEMLNTGHRGSITTIHANDARSVEGRLASLIKQSPVGQTLGIEHIIETIRTSIDVIAMFKGTYLAELYYDPNVKLNIMNRV